MSDVGAGHELLEMRRLEQRYSHKERVAYLEQADRAVPVGIKAAVDIFRLLGCATVLQDHREQLFLCHAPVVVLVELLHPE